MDTPEARAIRKFLEQLRSFFWDCLICFGIAADFCEKFKLRSIVLLVCEAVLVRMSLVDLMKRDRQVLVGDDNQRFCRDKSFGAIRVW